MKPLKEDIVVEPCDICGDPGFYETIVTCSKCNINREHAYCMRFNTLKIPKNWVCEACESKHVATSPRKVNQDIGKSASKRHQTVPTGKVKFLCEDEVIRLSSGNFAMKPVPANSTLFKSQKASATSKNVPFVTPKSNPRVSPPKILDKLPRIELHKKPMTNQNDSSSLSKGPPKECIGENKQTLGRVIPDKKVQAHNLQKEKPKEGPPFEDLSTRKSSTIIKSGGVCCGDAECNQSNAENSDSQSIQENLNFYKKFLPYSIPVWRGQFQILQTAASSEFYEGFEALPPCIVNSKAYKFSRQMPSVLQLELHPALNVLTDLFQDDSPKLEDIALYFFPSTERSTKNLYSTLNFMNAEKSMLRSYIDGVELLVFTINQLDMNSRGVMAALNSEHFLWGILRKKKMDKAIERVVPDMEPIDMDIDMIGGKDVMDRADHIRKDKLKTYSLKEYHNNLSVPPGFEDFAKMC